MDRYGNRFSVLCLRRSFGGMYRACRHSPARIRASRLVSIYVFFACHLLFGFRLNSIAKANPANNIKKHTLYSIRFCITLLAAFPPPFILGIFRLLSISANGEKLSVSCGLLPACGEGNSSGISPPNCGGLNPSGIPSSFLSVLSLKPDLSPIFIVPITVKSI